MNKILGIFALFLFICVFTTVLNPDFISPYNMYNITRWSALFGILGIGVAFVIITGGIDLSIGSVVGLVGCLLPYWLVRGGWPLAAGEGWQVLPTLAVVMLISVFIGWINGMLVTKLELQPFIVTLCGFMFYRGLARTWTDDQTQGFGREFDSSLRLLATGKPCVVSTLIMFFGGLIALWCLWRLMRHLFSKTENVSFLLVTLLGGLLLAGIGSSRFWNGYEIDAGVEVLRVGDYRIRTVDVTVPEEISIVGRTFETEVLPKTLMKWAGVAIFIPSCIWFVTLGFLHSTGKTTAAVLLVILAGIACTATILSFEAFGYRYVGPAPVYRNLQPDDLWRIRWILSDDFSTVVTGEVLKWLILGLVFLVVGLAMGAVAWLVGTVLSRGGDQARTAFAPTLGAGVTGLLGMTALPMTMVPMPMLIMIGLAAMAAIFLNNTIYGRYLLALGRNEKAARFSGINTDRMVILAYMICSAMAGLAGILFALDINSIQPSGHGNFYELYAIAAAVLGGCSLRGGEGNVLGVVIGAAVMRVLYNAINILGIPTQMEFSIIAVVILTGAMVDVVVKRVVARRRVDEDVDMDTG